MEPRQQLFEEALEAATAEADKLKTEIDQLRRALARLEYRKKVADQMVDAIRKWVGTASSQTFDPSVFEYAGAEREEVVGLSEEEVSLIAYPEGHSESHATP